jgi:hypothetical protein
MVTIEQTVDIPPDRRVFLDVPADIPEGRVKLAITFKPAGDAGEPRVVDWIFHPVQTYRAVSWAKTLGKLDEYRRTHGPFFDGTDGLAYQRKLRGEWPD